MVRMQRTQIYLEPELAADLARVARERGISRAELIRQAARQYVQHERAEEGPIWSLVGMASSGHTDTAERHDEVYVEEEMKRWRS